MLGMTFENSMIILVVSICTSGIIIGMMGFFMYTYLKDRSKSRYDFDKSRAILSDIRHSYEKQIAMLSMQMTATEQRWFDANHLLVSSQNLQNSPNYRSGIHINHFLGSAGITEEDLNIDENQVFVLTPFHSSEESAYRMIQSTCRRFNLVCVRGDEKYVDGDVLSQIIKNIVKSRLVIANISSRNANVFYELGIAHAIDKQIILVSKEPDDTPFDVRSKRIVTFKNLHDLDIKLYAAINHLLTQDIHS